MIACVRLEENALLVVGRPRSVSLGDKDSQPKGPCLQGKSRDANAPPAARWHSWRFAPEARRTSRQPFALFGISFAVWILVPVMGGVE